MKPQFGIYALLLMVVILVVVFWRRSVRSPTNPEQTQATVEPASAPPAKVRPAKQDTPGVMPTDVSSSAAPKQPAASETRTAEGFQRYAEEHNVPIDFQGQVIGQDSNALSGVAIKVVVRHWTMPDLAVPLAGTKSIPLERVTGADGRFEISGATGDGFDLQSISKPGYEAELTRRSFGATEGSYSDPVLFRMWSTDIHEQLITGAKKFPIVPDGRPYLIDLTGGTISESGPGDLKAWVKYAEPPTRDQLSDWSCELDVINGGLLEQPLGAFMSYAPAQGYTPSFQFTGQLKPGQSGSSGERHFYLSLKNGQEYGNIAITLYAPFNNQTPGLIRLSYAINPSGSRVLR